MIKNTEGIVLRSILYGEADLIITYLSRDYGIIKAFAKSPRKIKSRFGSSLEPLTYSRIALLGKENTSLPLITRSDIIKSFQILREDMKCFMDLSEIIKMNLTFIHEGSPVKDLFELFFHTLYYLQNGGDRTIYLLFYKIKFLEKTGYIPNLDVCGRCGVANRSFNNNGNNLYFHINQGALLCNSCCDEDGNRINVAKSTLNFYNTLKNWDVNKLTRLKVPSQILFELLGIIDAHICFIKSTK